jgi:hypothetical protein
LLLSPVDSSFPPELSELTLCLYSSVPEGAREIMLKKAGTEMSREDEKITL